jgi:hypothetical protein
VSLTFLPPAIAGLFSVGAVGSTYWAWGEDFNQNLFGLFSGTIDPMELGLQYSTAFITTQDTDLKLGSVTLGLLPTLNLVNAREIAYLVRDSDGILGGLVPGYYAGYDGQIPFIGEYANTFCNFFGGFGVKCPDVLRFDISTRFGWYRELETGNVGLAFKWLGVIDIACRFAGDILVCNNGRRDFQVIREPAGLTATVTENGSTDVVYEISQDAFDTFQSFSVEAVGYYDGINTIQQDPVQVSFGSIGSQQDPVQVSFSTFGGGNRHLTAASMYGFRREQTCVTGPDDVSIFDTSDSDSFATYSIQFGHDGTLRNCFTACVLRAKSYEPEESTAGPPCCEYRSMGYKGGSCHFRIPSNTGTTTTTESYYPDTSVVYSSGTFAEDFLELVSS